MSEHPTQSVIGEPLPVGIDVGDLVLLTDEDGETTEYHITGITNTGLIRASGATFGRAQFDNLVEEAAEVTIK